MQVEISPIGEGPHRGAEGQRRCPVCLAVFRTGYDRCPADGGELVELDGDPLLGVELAGRYVLEELVGQGSMGLIYRARHVALPRRFAVKILFGDLVVDPRMRIRFAQEAALASRLSHPNVVPVVDFGRSDGGLLYLVMDFVEGEGLGELLAREGALAPRAALRLVRQLAQGLGHAHRRGLVHRDFKPGNVLLEPQEDGGLVPRILDFGLAISTRDRDENPCRLTELGLIIGTPIYIAPEQVLDLAVDHRADLFALGVVLYEMLAGKPPFDGRPVEIAHKNVLHPVPSIAARSPGTDAPPALEAVATRLLAKSPADRYGSADEVVRALDAIDGELARRGRRARTMSVPSIEDTADDTAPVVGEGAIDRAARTSRGLVVLPPRAQPAPGLDSLTGLERIAPVRRAAGPTRRAGRGSMRRGLAVGGALLFAGAVGFYAAASRPAPASARSTAPAAAPVTAGVPRVSAPMQQARWFQPAPRPPRALSSFARQTMGPEGDEVEAAIGAPEAIGAAAADAGARRPAAIRSDTASAARAPVPPASGAAAADRRIAIPAVAAATSSNAVDGPSPGAAPGAVPAAGPGSVAGATPGSTAVAASSPSAATPAAAGAASSSSGPSSAPPASTAAFSGPTASAAPASASPRSITARASASAPLAPRPRGPIAVPTGRAHRLSGSLPVVTFPRWEQAPGAIAARLCIDARGAVTQVAVVSTVSSGVRAELERGMSTWRYRPILDGGSPVPACFATRFRVEVE